MSIPYTQLKDIELSPAEGVNIQTLNKVFSKLIENDKNLSFSTANMPTIWEASWYNDPNGIPGYSKGDAVWINTEQTDEFIRSRADDIRNYAKTNTAVTRQIEDALAAGDMTSYYQILKKFAFGKFSGQRLPIYYIGNILEKVQIRISDVDDNKDLPTSDTWHDFFVRYDDIKTKAQILSVYDNVLDAQFQRHMIDFHLSGVIDDVTQISSEYMLTDMSNVSKSQKFISHYWHQKSNTGFDTTIKFKLKNFGNGTCKWFRIWNSGMLEHGGIIDISNPELTEDVSNGTAYTVNLQWSIDSKKAPIYDYPVGGLMPFYGDELKYCDDLPIVKSKLWQQMRYSVALTQIGKTESAQPYDFNSGVIPYDTCDICFMNNDNFSFIIKGRIQPSIVSYYVRGYSLNSIRY